MIRLGSLNMNDTADVDGDRFRVGAIPGYESPDTDVAYQSRHAYGASLTRARWAQRTINLQGHGISQTAAGVWRVRRKLATAFALITVEDTLYVDEPSPGVPTQMSVRLESEPTVERAGPYAVSFDIPLVALDPAKYAQGAETQVVQDMANPTLSVTSTYTNAGNLPTRPYFTFSNPGNCGTYLRFHSATDAQRMVVIDAPGLAAAGGNVFYQLNFKTRTLKRFTDGVDFYRFITTKNWWELKPGANSILVTRQAAGGAMTSSGFFRSAWV